MATQTPTYPVRLDGHLDPRLSRGLWLVKWILVIPHYLVLLALWIVFCVLSIVALVAILFTGQYPRGIFDFNVGVLRWSWRVGFYAYAANGTDRYPPFTLADVPDYPARLEVEYPQHLSRGLVLVKWWLLAIPHYLLLAVFGGGAWYFLDQGDWRFGPSSGLIGLLVLIGAVAMLVTGRYPRGLFDLILGLDRWVIRVVAYAGLMTDRYPPFRLDMGEDEPGGAPPETAEAAVAAPRARTWTAGAIIAVIASSLAVLVGAAVGALGVGALVVDRTARDADGFLTSPMIAADSQTAAITSGFEATSDSLVFDALATNLRDASFLLEEDRLGTVRVRVDAAAPMFVGIAPRAAVDRYLAGVAHDEITGVGNDRLRYDASSGAAAAGAPGDAGIWTASAAGTGRTTLTWRLDEGRWALVVMRRDGQPGIDSRVAFGAPAHGLGRLGAITLAIGAVVLVAGAAGLLLALGRTRTA